MSLSPDLDHTRALATATLSALQDHGIPPTPDNYEIWFAHLSGANPALSEAIRNLVAQDGVWTQTTADELHLRYLRGLPDDAMIAGIGAQMGAEIASVLDAITQAGSDARSYGQVLDAASGQISHVPEPHAMALTVKQLAAATRTIQARTSLLEGELARASGEVATLQARIEQIRQESLTDGLTGLGNRRHFDERLAEAVQECGETGEPVCLVMADVDHFKQFNDHWGHQTGDQVLRLVAACLRQNTKGRDTAARYGGEEFAVILPATSLTNAGIVAEQIRQTIESKNIVKRSTGEKLGSITISLGVSVYRPGEPVADFARRADDGLYAAKHRGRNRVVLQDTLTAEDVRVA